MCTAVFTVQEKHNMPTHNYHTIDNHVLNRCRKTLPKLYVSYASKALIYDVLNRHI